MSKNRMEEINRMTDEDFALWLDTATMQEIENYAVALERYLLKEV